MPVYVKRLHIAPDTDKSDLPKNKSTNKIQSIVGTSLCYSRSIDPTMLRATNKISRVQLKPTRVTKEKTKMLLYYAETYPNVFICNKSSNMVIHVYSDSAYITIPEVRSCYNVHFYLINWPSTRAIKTNPKINSPIHTE